MLTVVAIVLALLVIPSPWGAVAVVAALAVDVTETVVLVRRNRRRKVVVGVEALVGRVGVATSRVAPAGRVRVDGEIWAARAAGPGPIEPGSEVVVEAVEDLVLRVRPA